MCPEVTASIWGWLTFSWAGPTLLTGYRRQLGFDDIWAIPPHEVVALQSEKFRKNWAAEMQRAKPSLVRAARGGCCVLSSEGLCPVLDAVASRGWCARDLHSCREQQLGFATPILHHTMQLRKHSSDLSGLVGV